MTTPDARRFDPIATALREEAHDALNRTFNTHLDYALCRDDDTSETLLDASIAADHAVNFAQKALVHYIAFGSDPVLRTEEPDADADSVNHACYAAEKAMEAKLKERMTQVRTGMTATVRAAESATAIDLAY